MASTETAAAEVRGQIGELLSRSVRYLRIVLIGSAVTVVLLVLVLGALVGITADTNSAVKDRAVLEKRNAELEDKNAQLEDVSNQATDWVVRLSQMLQAHGIEPPEIVIRPTTTTTEPGG